LEEDGGNKSNTFKFKFKNTSELEIQRKYWSAFLSGANSSWYAPNASICFNYGLNLYQFDMELLAIKLMYGNFKENTLNTTMFLGNAS